MMMTTTTNRLGLDRERRLVNVTFDASKLGEVVVPKAKRPERIKRRTVKFGREAQGRALQTQSLQELWNQPASCFPTTVRSIANTAQEGIDRRTPSS
jgi:hypothetical protein